MSKKMPPVPPENRSDKGPGDPGQVRAEDADRDTQKANPGKIGQAGNSKVNTTNQGYQQDR